MKVRRQRRPALFWWVTGAIVIVAVVAAAVSVFVARQSHESSKRESTQQTESAVPPKPVSVASNDLFFGNAYWGRYVNQWATESGKGTAYPFSRLNEFDRESYNAWVAGLECPTVAGLNLTPAQEDATLTFNCSPEYLPEASKWFTSFMLANNHTDNQGADGFAETQQQLGENNIQYFGHYDPRVTDEICEVTAWPVTVTYDDDSTKDAELPIALCGFHGVFRIPPEESIAVMEQYAQYMPVIAMTHMGAEYEAAPGSYTINAYRSMIDHGADMVLGDHPHWIQNTEAYEGKLIVYSMGNFIFDQQANAEVTRSAAIRVLMQTNEADSATIDQWLALGSTCTAYHDDCLAQIEQQGLKKLPFTYQFGVVGVDTAQKITKPATEEQTQKILERLDWNTTMQGLVQPYSALQ